MFKEIEHDGVTTDNEITIEPLDYNVFSAYILPIVKRQMEVSKSDRLMKQFIAQNLGRLARLAIRILEISIYYANKKRLEILNQKSQMASKRIDLAPQEIAQQEDEDSHIP